MEKKILAKVGQKEITNLDVQSAIQGLDPYQAQQFQTEEGQKYVLDDLINQELLYMYAKDNKIDQDEQFRNEMKRVEENVLKQYVINKILTSVKLTEEEKKAFYEAQKQSFSKPETANAKHILVDSEEKANDILGKINAGDVSFEDAAKEVRKREKIGHWGLDTVVSSRGKSKYCLSTFVERKSRYLHLIEAKNLQVIMKLKRH